MSEEKDKLNIDEYMNIGVGDNPMNAIGDKLVTQEDYLRAKSIVPSVSLSSSRPILVQDKGGVRKSIQLLPEEKPPLVRSTAKIDLKPQVKVASVKISPAKLAPVKLAPVKIAPVKIAPVKLAPVSKIEIKKPEVKLSPVSKIEIKKPEVKLSPVSKIEIKKPEIKLSPVKLTPVTKPEVKLSPVKIAPMKIAPVKITPITKPEIKVAPVSKIEIKKPEVKLAPVKITPITKPEIKVAPVKITPITKPEIKVAPAKITPITKPEIKVAPVKITPITKPEIKVAPAIKEQTVRTKQSPIVIPLSPKEQFVAPSMPLPTPTNVTEGSIALIQRLASPKTKTYASPSVKIPNIKKPRQTDKVPDTLPTVSFPKISSKVTGIEEDVHVSEVQPPVAVNDTGIELNKVEETKVKIDREKLLASSARAAVNRNVYKGEELSKFAKDLGINPTIGKANLVEAIRVKLGW